MKKFKVSTLVGLGVLTAIIIVLQALASNIRFGMFSITLVLVPIIVGAALFGIFAAAWLGAVFGAMVLLTDAGVFLAINAPGTVVTVMLKGIAAGLAAALIYRLLSKKSRFVAVLLSALAAPVANTGIFLIGCRVFFFDTIQEWGAAAGYENAFSYMIFGLVGVNFIVEAAVNLVLSSAIVQIIRVLERSFASSEKPKQK